MPLSQRGGKWNFADFLRGGGSRRGRARQRRNHAEREAILTQTRVEREDSRSEPAGCERRRCRSPRTRFYEGELNLRKAARS